MGARHAALGAFLASATIPAAGLAGAPLLPWYAAWVGGSMLPDIDTHRANAATVWGPISGVFAAIAGPLVGGHRGLTHRWWAPLVALIVGELALMWWPAAVALTAYVIGLALRMAAPYTTRWLRPWPVNLALSLGVASAIIDGHAALWWAPPVVAAAVAGHIWIGDRIPLRTGTAPEVAIGGILLAAAVWLTWMQLA